MCIRDSFYALTIKIGDRKRFWRRGGGYGVRESLNGENERDLRLKPTHTVLFFVNHFFFSRKFQDYVSLISFQTCNKKKGAYKYLYIK